MNDESRHYIATPHTVTRPEKLDVLLQKRMREFLLKRRQKVWQREGR